MLPHLLHHETNTTPDPSSPSSNPNPQPSFFLPNRTSSHIYTSIPSHNPTSISFYPPRKQPPPFALLANRHLHLPCTTSHLHPFSQPSSRLLHHPHQISSSQKLAPPPSSKHKPEPGSSSWKTTSGILLLLATNLKQSKQSPHLRNSISTKAILDQTISIITATVKLHHHPNTTQEASRKRQPTSIKTTSHL